MRRSLTSRSYLGNPLSLPAPKRRTLPQFLRLLGQRSLTPSSVIKGDGTYSFRIDNTSSDGVIYSSKETSDATRRPQLILTTGDAPPCATTATASATTARSEPLR
jgi:hypothetical protein